MLENLKKGDKAFYVNYNNETECKITKVSDEYINAIYIDKNGYKHSVKFRKEDGYEKVEYGSGGKLYTSEAAYLEHIKQAELTNEIKIKLNRKTYKSEILTEVLNLLTK
jgi:hypothetical protein